MRSWLLGLALGAVLTLVTTQISLIAMVAAVVTAVFLGLIVPPRYAFMSGGLIAVGGIWLAGTVPNLNCQLGAATCGNPYPLIALASIFIIGGVIAGLVTARTARQKVP